MRGRHCQTAIRTTEREASSDTRLESHGTYTLCNPHSLQSQHGDHRTIKTRVGIFTSSSFCVSENRIRISLIANRSVF